MKKFFINLNIYDLMPMILATLLILMSAMPLRLPGLSAFLPLMDFMIIFYFALYWPGALSGGFIMVLGLIKDSLSGAPMGSSSMLGLTLWYITISQRERVIEAPFPIVWAVFFVTSLAFSILQWLLYSFLNDMLLPVGAAVMQFLLTVAFYPFLHSVCDELREVAPEENHYE